MISEKGKPAPLGTTKRWVVERTNSWTNAHKKLVWCTERRDRVIDFWIAFSEVVINHCRQARQRSLETLPLGESSPPQAVRNHLLAEALSHQPKNMAGS